MKHLTIILLALVSAFASFAQEVTSYAYVTKSNVNLRTQPSTSSAVFGKAEFGNIYLVMQTKGDWTQIEVSNGPDSDYPWISSKFVETLNHTGFPKEKLDASFSYEDGPDFGMLSFENAGKDEYDNDLIRYSYWIKNRDMQNDGGTGIVVNESGTVLYLGSLSQPEQYMDEVGSAIYDEKKGLLWYGGFLWKEDK